MILQLFNRLRRMSIKIRYDTTLTEYQISRAVLLACVVVAITWLNLYLQNLVGESQESIVHSRKLNVTHITPFFYCDLPSDDCLCSVLSNISDTSEKCVTNVQIVTNRIIPLISFVLQILLVRELFSLNTDHRRVIIHTLWIASIIIFIVMTITIYLSSCYHVYTIITLYFTGGSLCILSCHNMVTDIQRMDPMLNRNTIGTVHKLEKTNHAGRSSQ
jgi:hypothetical protein